MYGKLPKWMCNSFCLTYYAICLSKRIAIQQKHVISGQWLGNSFEILLNRREPGASEVFFVSTYSANEINVHGFSAMIEPISIEFMIHRNLK